MAVFAEPVEVVLDLTVSLVGNTLSATAAGMSYQWVDCNNSNEPIDGAEGQSYTATENGNYAVIITDGNCSQTSECTNVTVTGVNDLDGDDAFSVYPNPFTDRIVVQSAAHVGSVRVELFTLSGQLVISETRNAAEVISVNTSALSPGSYLLRLSSGAARSSLRVVK
jgi:hypothetical protein